ncbi:hypothetical protein GY45DRAFT_1374106 [Cubamyces sp. BRFM 1775]|nr:hypothetical protein GY45DRAFT_1374106 [Cubamyces sp. BRFM 1775]
MSTEVLRVVALVAPDPTIKYDGLWSNTTMYGDPTEVTYSPGATASLPFTGLAIYVFGWVGPLQPPTPVIECYIDGNMTSRGPITLPGAAQGYKYWTQVILCEEEGLENGNHTMKVIVSQASQAYPLMLDMFMFRLSRQQYDNLADNLELEQNSSSTVPTTASSTTLLGSGTSTVPATVSSKSSIVAPVIRGVIGAVLAVLLVALGVFFIMRRRKQAYAKIIDDEPHLPISTSSVSPYTYEPKPLFLSSASLHATSETPTLPPSTIGATYHPPATEPAGSAPDAPRVSSDAAKDQPTTLAPGDGSPQAATSKRVAASLVGALERVRAGQTADDEPRDSNFSTFLPSEAPPLYSERLGALPP